MMYGFTDITFNLIHGPCHRSIRVHLNQQTAQTITNNHLSAFAPSTPFDFYKVIIREVYTKAHKYNKLSQTNLAFEFDIQRTVHRDIFL